MFLTSHMQGLTGTPRRAEERSQLFGGGSCSSLSEALNDHWVTRDTAKRNILRQAKMLKVAGFLVLVAHLTEDRNNTHTHICVENLDDTVRNYEVSTKW